MGNFIFSSESLLSSDVQLLDWFKRRAKPWSGFKLRGSIKTFSHCSGDFFFNQLYVADCTWFGHIHFKYNTELHCSFYEHKF